MRTRLLTRCVTWYVCALLAMLAGCASTRTNTPGAHWQGKLAVKVFSAPVQSFSAEFDLQGNPDQGELVLSTALGTTVARIEWHGAWAALHTPREERRFASLSELVHEVTGADFPVTSLFDWVQGRESTSSDWQADLSDIAQGHIQAHTVNQETASELKVILEP